MRAANCPLETETVINKTELHGKLIVFALIPSTVISHCSMSLLCSVTERISLPVCLLRQRHVS